MYKLLIVDDEEIEREGMEKFIQWEKYGIELVGSAWNGVDGFEKIHKQQPDIVLTDIKMPIMDGIELIRKARKSFPEIEFVVLSGYGEYEFTSRAMEEGVRHYILKPCDEQKIAAVLDKVKADLEETRRDRREKQDQDAALTLLPRAKEQVFRNMLLGREPLKKDYRLLLEGIGSIREVVVLAFRGREGFDDLEQFVIGNILSDLLGKDRVLLSTSIRNDVLILVNAKAGANIEPAAARTREEFKELEAFPIQAAVSRAGTPEEMRTLYLQVQGLFAIGGMERQSGFLHEGLFRESRSDPALLVDYRRITEAKEYGDILFEIYLAFVKMELKSYTIRQETEIFQWALNLLFGEQTCSVPPHSGEKWNLLEQMTDLIAEKQGLGPVREKKGQRIRKILLAVYRNIQNPEMNIRYLSRNILFINEDYFGRIFTQNRKEKFSSFLVRCRITLAQRLLQYDPELKISSLAETVGYSSDGQYFSKEFRRMTGKTPTEYRDLLKK